MTEIVDTSVANTTYICEASPGTLSSAPGWRISKVVVSNGVTTTTWAGAGLFNQIADNRLSLIYA